MDNQERAKPILYYMMELEGKVNGLNCEVHRLGFRPLIVAALTKQYGKWAMIALWLGGILTGILIGRWI